MSWGALADVLVLTPERVVSHLVECACSGMETDITRLAAQLQIGYPNSVSLVARSICNIASEIRGGWTRRCSPACQPMSTAPNSDLVCRSHG